MRNKTAADSDPPPFSFHDSKPLELVKKDTIVKTSSHKGRRRLTTRLISELGE
jgi:hypothetical protein